MSIASLPEEIFIGIVETLVLPDNEQRGFRINILRLVCRRWDKSIQQAPSLWTYIWNGTNNAYVERALLRSGTLSLKVRVSPWEKVKNQNRERFWAALLPHVDRWEHAELSGRIGDDIPLALAHTAAPMLRSLALDSRLPQVLDGLFPWPLPNLESLRVQNLGFPWAPQRFPSGRLKHLLIRLDQRAVNHIIGHTSTLIQFLDTLRECQGLVSLHLTGLPLSPGIPEGRLTPISLPNLEDISLRHFNNPVEGKLLETIHIPNCRVIKVQLWSGGSTDDYVLRALENLGSRIGNMNIPCRPTFEIQDSERMNTLCCDLRAADSGGTFMHLRLEALQNYGYRWTLDQAGPFLHNWVSSFGPNTGWDVQVTSEWAVCLADMLPPLATHFPKTLTLTIARPLKTHSRPEPLLTLFDPTGGLAFPCLEQLEISYCDRFAGGIIQIIFKRVIGRGTTSREGVTALRMRIKVPMDMDEVERVELAWLGDQVPNLTIQEAAAPLYETMP